MKTIARLIALSLLALAIQAQGIDLKARTCASFTSKLPAYVPVQVIVGGKATTINLPICLNVGSGLTVNMNAAAGPALESVPIPPPATTPTAPVPTMVSETIALDPQTPDAPFSVTLGKTPAPGSLVIVQFQGSRLSGGEIRTVAATKSFTVTLPQYRPFDGDRLLTIYWTLE